MTPEDVRERLRLGEDTRTEFKDDRVSLPDIEKTMVAFANGMGGDLFIGVADDGKPLGMSDIDQTIRRIEGACRNNVDPSLTAISAEKHELDGRRILVVHVPRGSRRPYRSSAGVYYVRGLQNTRAASREELLEIYQAAEQMHPDELPVETATLDDLDVDYLCGRRPELAPLDAERRLRALTIMKVLHPSATPQVPPTIAGIVCFGRDPQKHRPYARITAIRHKGVEISEDFAERIEIGGHLEHQLVEAQSFVDRHVAEVWRSGLAPIHPPPTTAIREALVNALAHRDYLAGAQTRLFVYDDRLEVISPGKLLNSITVDQMRYGCHAVRNQTIFQHLARLRVATDAGRGVPAMLQAMRAAGLPEPGMAPTGSDFRVTFRLK